MSNKGIAGKVLVCVESFSMSSKEPLELLLSNQFEVHFNNTGRSLEWEDYPRFFTGIDFSIAGLEKYDESFFKQFPNIKVISRVGVGIDNIDLASARRNNTYVYNTINLTTNAVAELTLGLMISLARGIIGLSNNMSNGKWTPVQGMELGACTVGIVGFGSIGKLVAKILSELGVRVIAVGKSWDHEFAERYNIKRVSLDYLMSESDFVTLHLPLKRETMHMINSGNLDLMKKTAFIINTSRGGIIDDIALSEKLKSGRIAGAALDVFENEPDVGPYKGLQNVILTPHIGSNTVRSRYKMEMSAVKNILEYVNAVRNNLTIPKGVNI